MVEILNGAAVPNEAGLTSYQEILGKHNKLIFFKACSINSYSGKLSDVYVIMRLVLNE